jgi:hypothetical protein
LAKKNKKLEIVVVVAVFTVLILVSEIIFMLKNRHKQNINNYIHRMYVASKEGNVELSIYFLCKASNFRYDELEKKFPNITFNNSTKCNISIEESDELTNQINSYLTTIDYNKLQENYYSELSKTYFKLGVISFNQLKINIAEMFLKQAVTLDPEWSYYHIELANFYLLQGYDKKATETINFCLNFQIPSEHCKKFMSQNIERDKPKNVGFLENEIMQI